MRYHIVLLDTAHGSLDDRVFYHQGKSLLENGYHVTIISTTETVETVKNSINICSYNFNSFSRKEKQKKIVEILAQLNPDIIICDTPIAVLSAQKYRKNNQTKIIYDVTEWYPSTNNLKNTKGLKKWLRFIVLFFFNLYAGVLSNGFIFGEKHKATFFRFFYFWKLYIILPYFPDLKYIETKSIRNINQEIRLFYGGNIQPQRGFPQVIESVVKAAKRKPETIFQLHILCNLSTKNDISYFENLALNLPSNIEIHQNELLPFVDFCQYITNMDLFFDLRTISLESNHSLPIKLFYYLACGRPIIYSKLKSITSFLPDISFGYVVNPSDTDCIADCVENYLDNPKLYSDHCQSAINLSKEKYNWQKIESRFMNFIRQISG